MPKQPPDHHEPLVAFTYARITHEPNSPDGGLGANHEQNEKEQYRWTEQVPESLERNGLREENRNSPREAGGRQDKIARLRDSTGSRQPVSNKQRLLSQQSPGSNSERVKKRAARNRAIVGWASPALKAEIKRIAQLHGLSVSTTIVNLLQQAVEQDLHRQHDSLLAPLVQQAVRHEMRALGNRLASLVVAILLGVIEIRQLLVNVLVRVPTNPQMSETVLNDIRDGSAKRARQEFRQQSPQLKTLIEEEMARWND